MSSLRLSRRYSGAFPDDTDGLLELFQQLESPLLEDEIGLTLSFVAMIRDAPILEVVGPNLITPTRAAISRTSHLALDMTIQFSGQSLAGYLTIANLIAPIDEDLDTRRTMAETNGTTNFVNPLSTVTMSALECLLNVALVKASGPNHQGRHHNCHVAGMLTSLPVRGHSLDTVPTALRLEEIGGLGTPTHEGPLGWTGVAEIDLNVVA